MKYLKLYEETESAESASTAATITYSNPLAATMKKDTSDGKQNVIAITANNTTRKYRVVGNVVFKEYDLNFKDLVKKENGDLIFNRYVEKGVDPQKITFSQVSDVLQQAAKGVADINPVTGIHFYKI
jgi:hypothetical protein